MSMLRDPRALFRARDIEKRIASGGGARMLNRDPGDERSTVSCSLAGIS
jgi:hypothetical protein